VRSGRPPGPERIAPDDRRHHQPGRNSGRAASLECTPLVEHHGEVEDDDVVLGQAKSGYVFDRERGTSDPVLLDAGTLEDVAAVQLPGRVPTGFHGSWNPTSR
jgi:carotenoid cleavage dioxygenase